MGWVIMSERELNRVEVLSQVAEGRCSTADAGSLLDVSQRQIQRMMLRYRDGGAASIRHKSRGRAPNNQKSVGVRDYALSLIRENYPDFGPTLVAEKLEEKHALKLAPETVRKWMIAEGIWLNCGFQKNRTVISQIPGQPFQ